MGKSKLNRDFYGYIYILPATVFILLFAVIPIGMAFVYSFNSYNIIQPMTFVGIDNYTRLFSDPYMLAAIRNTFVYTLITVPVQTFLAMAAAALITSRSRSPWIGFVKSTMFIPVISSMVLVGTLWSIMYNPQGGLINQFLGLFGVAGPNWLGSKNTALLSVCIVGIWKNVGYFLVIYIAAIMDIPRSLFEAARVDGANGMQQFWWITLPSLKPITFLVVILGTIWSFQVFDMVYTMTGGGPGTSTITMVYQIYNTAFRNYDMGYACAMAILLFVIIVAVSVLQQKLLAGKKEN